MHASVMVWLRQQVADRTVPHLRDADVLEVGSFNENGTPREIFEPITRTYVGVDVRPGRDVDQVAAAADLPFSDNAFDLVLSTEMLEHDPRPWLSIPEMTRVLRKGGHMLLTARGFDVWGGYPRHDCPLDYWRYCPTTFRMLFNDAGLDSVEISEDPEVQGVFGHVVKP